MADSEKVIEELERLSEWFFHQYQVVYDGDAPNYYDAYKTVDDALALLKEQEAVEPILEQDSMVCRICGHEVIWQKTLGDGIWVDEKLDYCPHCGRSVKWND